MIQTHSLIWLIIMTIESDVHRYFVALDSRSISGIYIYIFINIIYARSFIYSAV